MAKQFLTDTNIVVGYLENQLPQRAVNDLRSAVIKISIVTRIELLVWPDASVHQLQILQSFIASSLVYDLDEPAILETINIRKLYKIKLPMLL